VHPAHAARRPGDGPRLGVGRCDRRRLRAHVRPAALLAINRVAGAVVLLFGLWAIVGALSVQLPV